MKCVAVARGDPLLIALLFTFFGHGAFFPYGRSNDFGSLSLYGAFTGIVRLCVGESFEYVPTILLLHMCLCVRTCRSRKLRADSRRNSWLAE
jgi:hypothetical protein